MKKLALVLAISLTILSCKKEECEQNNFGEVCFENNTNESISVSLDGTLTNPNWKVIDAGDVYCYKEISSGPHDYATLSFSGISTNNTFDLVSCNTDRVQLN